MLLGSACVKAARKHIDEIDTWLLHVREGKPHGGKQTCAKLPANETLVGDNAKEEGDIFMVAFEPFLLQCL